MDIPTQGRILATLLCGLCLLPRAGQAQSPKGPEAFLQAARRLYDDLEYERALEQLSEGRRSSRGVDDDVRFSLLEGAILADLGREEASDAAFKAALVLQPTAALPVEVSPKVRQRFERLRQEVRHELDADERNQVVVQAEPLPAIPPTPVQSPAQAQPVSVAASRGARAQAWLPATLGGGLLVGGGVSYLLARGEQSKLRDNDASLASFEDVKRSTSRGKTYQWVGLGLAGAGVVSLGISAGMYLLGGPPKPRTLALEVGTDGTSAFLMGRWP